MSVQDIRNRHIACVSSKRSKQPCALCIQVRSEFELPSIPLKPHNADTKMDDSHQLAWL